MDLSQAGLFTFYIFSLRLDTPFHSPPVVTLFVNQYDTADCPGQSFFPRSVSQDAVSRQRGPAEQHRVPHAWQRSRTSYETHSPSSSIPRGQHSACRGPLSRWTAQPSNIARRSRKGTTGALKRRKPEWATRFIAALSSCS